MPVLTNALVLEVRDRPVPQGSMRHIGGGRILSTNDRELKTWREAVKTAAVGALGDNGPLTGPVAVETTFTLAKPGSAPKRRTSWPVKRPDVDKLARGVLDALTAAGVWTDDAQVVELTARKVYPEEGIDALTVPGALIRVWGMGVSGGDESGE